LLQATKNYFIWIAVPRCSSAHQETAKMNLKNDLAPEAVPLSRAPAIFGISRSGIYRLAASGSIRLFKVGATTLVDADSIRVFLGQQPSLELRRDPRRLQPVSGSNLIHAK